MIILEVDSSLNVLPLLLSKIPLDDTSSLELLTHEVPSFDIEFSEDRLTAPYVLSKEVVEVV